MNSNEEECDLNELEIVKHSKYLDDRITEEDSRRYLNDYNKRALSNDNQGSFMKEVNKNANKINNPESKDTLEDSPDNSPDVKRSDKTNDHVNEDSFTSRTPSDGTMDNSFSKNSALDEIISYKNRRRLAAEDVDTSKDPISIASFDNEEETLLGGSSDSEEGLGSKSQNYESEVRNGMHETPQIIDRNKAKRPQDRIRQIIRVDKDNYSRKPINLNEINCNYFLFILL